MFEVGTTELCLSYENLLSVCPTWSGTGWDRVLNLPDGRVKRDYQARLPLSSTAPVFRVWSQFGNYQLQGAMEPMRALGYSATSSPNDRFGALCLSKPTLVGVRDTSTSEGLPKGIPIS